MTDTAFRRLVKRHGGCGLVVTEMVSSEGLVRGIDRTLEYAEYTEEERPVSIQIFGGDPDQMAEAARIVEGMGADIVDVNMGCPVPKIAKHNAGCSLMREPQHAAAIIAAMVKAVRDSGHRQDAQRLGRRRADRAGRGEAGRGCRRRGDHDSRPHREAVVHRHGRLGLRGARSPMRSRFRCSDRAIASSRSRSSSGCARASAASSSAAACCATRGSWRRRRTCSRAARARGVARGARPVSARLHRAACRRAGARGRGFPRIGCTRRHEAPRHDRWVINKLRALCSWYTKGLDNGSHLRIPVNAAESLDQLRQIIEGSFSLPSGSRGSYEVQARTRYGPFMRSASAGDRRVG